MDQETTYDLKKELRRDANINGILLTGFWILYFLISAAIGFILPRLIPVTDETLFSNAGTLIFYVLLYPIGFSLLFILFRILSRKHKDMKVLSCLRKPQMPAGWTFRWIILTIGATYLASFVSAFIFYIIEAVTHTSLTEAEMTSDKSVLGILTTVIAVPVFAPVFEELFFRGTLYRNVRKHGTWSMIIVCGITFGLWHANYPQFLFASAMGVFSCFLYEKTKSVIPSMIVHFTINSVGAFMMILIGQLGLESKNDLADMSDMTMFAEHPFIFIIIMLAGIMVIEFLICWVILLTLEIIFHPESFRLEKKNPEVSEGSKFITYITSPVMLIIMLAMLGFTVYRALGGEF